MRHFPLSDILIIVWLWIKLSLQTVSYLILADNRFPMGHYHNRGLIALPIFFTRSIISRRGLNSGDMCNTHCILYDACMYILCVDGYHHTRQQNHYLLLIHARPLKPIAHSFCCQVSVNLVVRVIVVVSCWHGYWKRASLQSAWVFCTSCPSRLFLPHLFFSSQAVVSVVASYSRLKAVKIS